MGVWAAYLGPSSANDLLRLLGPQAQIHVGQDFGLGVCQAGSPPVNLTRAPDGCVSAVIGNDREAGSSISIYPSNPHLTVRRDPFGMHSVYIAGIDSVTWFASDLRVLQQLPEVSACLDPVALHGYLCFSYVPTPLVVLSQISSLPAGEQLVVRAGGEWRSENTATWHEESPTKLSETEGIADLRDRLRAAVAQGLGHEREVGVFLSGGIDSSFVAALLVELGAKAHLFTLDFGPPFDTEVTYAQQVAAHLKQPLTIVPARPEQIRVALVPTAAALEQPFGDGVTVPLFLLGRAAAQEVGTVFNGEGGDQLFGGWTNKPMLAAEVYATKVYAREKTYLSTYHRFHDLADAYYTPRARELTQTVEVGEWVRPAFKAAGFTSLLHRLRAANLWLKGAQNIAPRAVQLGAVHGLRVKSPYFDRALTEWTFCLPPEWFVRGAIEKHLLKRAAEPYLPSGIIWREKRGMRVPTTEWCLGPLRKQVAHSLGPRRLEREGWFNPAAVTALRRGQDQSDEFRSRRIGEKLWALLMLQLWIEARDRPLRWPTQR